MADYRIVADQDRSESRYEVSSVPSKDLWSRFLFFLYYMMREKRGALFYLFECIALKLLSFTFQFSQHAHFVLLALLSSSGIGSTHPLPSPLGLLTISSFLLSCTL